MGSIDTMPSQAEEKPADQNAQSDSEQSGTDDESVLAPEDILHVRRKQNLQFQALLNKRAIEDTTTQVKGKQRMGDRPDEELTIASLVAKQDPGSTRLDPRAYQIELFERAKDRNIIAVLDTGSGKTLIAVLLLKHMLQNELNDRAVGKHHRTAFFLVDSVTLVFQQAAVLRNNLDQNVGHFYGAMGPDLWDEDTWQKHREQNMVIVCTADILQNALLNGFVKMAQINLLIFDEAHHTKKEHPYARIIRDFYFGLDPLSRPKIFGMTASPIDAKVPISHAAGQLELLLDSQIATTSNLALLHQIVRRPSEDTWTYRKPDPPFETDLFKRLHTEFGDIKALDSTFRFALSATSELGSWCADQVWARAIVEEVIPKLDNSINKAALNYGVGVIDQAEKDIQRSRKACDIVKAHPFKDPRETGQLSSKVEILLTILSHHFRQTAEKRCIVFVQQRNTARVLLDLCEQISIPNFRPGILVGVSSSDLIGATSFRQQFLTLVKFRKGEINCLFATSIAEEGLDIPDCNLIIRFNLYDTLIQYIQSRGRARHADSMYVHMIELGSDEHQKRLQEVKQAENMMQAFCRSLPKDRLLNQDDAEVDKIFDFDGGKRTYTIQSTGAKLTYKHAIQVLSRYAESLQYEKDASAQVSYFITTKAGSFECEVILPEKSPIRGLLGAPESSKLVAKQSAAFDTCILLRKQQLLDGNFRSVYHKRLPAMRNAKLAIVSKKTNEYNMICRPSIWKENQGDLPSMLYGTVFVFNPLRPLSRDYRSIVLLSRVKLPKIPTFPIYLENDRETTIQSTVFDNAISVGGADLTQLSNFTFSVFRDVFHKTFEATSEKFPYWLAPIKQGALIESTVTSPRDTIDWEVLHDFNGNEELRWNKSMDPASLLDRFLYDGWDGKKRFFPLSIDPSFQPSDPPPPGVPRRKWMDTILGYSLSLSKNSRVKFFEDADWEQPVFHAECVCLRRNFLDRATEKERAEVTQCVICAQPLNISMIPVPIVTSILAYPAIMNRLQSYLIVLEGCQSLGLPIKLEYALEAMTKDSDNTEEHRLLQLHVQRGMGKNYERLEFLGDSFLKMATSISLFCQYPDDDEYDYHVNRMVLICNRNLFNTAVSIDLYSYIRSRGFSRHTWYPPGLELVHGRNFLRHITAESTHNLGEKTIADVCEALIGASLLSEGGAHRFDMAVQSVTLFVNSANHVAKCWKDYVASYVRPSYQIKGADGFESDLANKIFEKLGYRFKYPPLLRSAFTHPSYPVAWARVPCYQRLEFLGDALLDMVCVEDLFDRFPDKDPQWLTEHKMAMVSNKFLGALAVELGFHRHLQHFSSPVQSSITRYAEDIQVAKEEGEGAMDYWLGTKESPKCLPDMIEAYLAAIFVDSDFDYSVIEAFYKRHIGPYFVDMSLYDTFANRHPTTFLFTRLTNEFGCEKYCLKAGEIPSVDSEPSTILAAVMIHGVSIAEAFGTSGRYAKVRASESALKEIEPLSREQYRNRYGCDCQLSEQEEDGSMQTGTAI